MPKSEKCGADTSLHDCDVRRVHVIGKVVDSSAIASWVRGSVAASAWFAVTHQLSSPAVS